jgi:hypothetical protein
LCKRFLNGNELDSAAFKIVDAATELFIPRRFAFTMMRIEARNQFFGQASAVLGRKRLR